MVPPVITVPANVYTSTSTSQASVNIGIASATDNVDGMVAVTNNAPATFPIGVTTVTYTSTDLAGNTATATQNVYVSYSSTVGGGTGGGSGGTTTPPPAGGGATVSSEAVYWHHNDHLGTPQALTDINGTKVWEVSQTPFGIATVNEDPDGDGQLVINNFRFPGQYYDAEIGLNYNYFRTFDPALGRYIQSDPIGLNGGMNTFAYVGGNPVNLVDPLGLRDIIAVVWGREFSTSSVGHVYLGETNGQVISSNFPNPHGTFGINTTKNWNETLIAEGRVPSGVYKIWVPDDASFNLAALLERQTKWWDWSPDNSSETNCTTAAYDSLKYGGVDISTPWVQPWSPNDFLDEMEKLANKPNSGVNKLDVYPWGQLR